MELRHYTGAPMTFHRDLIYLQRTNHKPHGLWVSVPGEDDWVSWNKVEQWAFIDYAYRVVLHAEADVRVMSDVNEFDAFHREYSVAPPWRPTADEWLRDIDWARVASDCDGVVIAPYLWNRRMNPHWYYSWDCASGCIWNLSAIRKVVPVE